MEKLSKEPMRECQATAHATVNANLSAKTDLLFVYDVISCAGKLSQLKFVLDAARYPLVEVEDCEFEKIYGPSKRLGFKESQRRESMKQDWWSAMYL